MIEVPGLSVLERPPWCARLDRAPWPSYAGERLTGHAHAHAIDGDTIFVAGIHVRLKGVAAPEVDHAGHRGEPGGEAAGLSALRCL